MSRHYKHTKSPCCSASENTLVTCQVNYFFSGSGVVATTVVVVVFAVGV